MTEGPASRLSPSLVVGEPFQLWGEPVITELAVWCKHLDYDMRTLFTEGLKDEVQLQMLRDCPKNLDELYHLVIDIDSHLYKMKKHLEESSG